VLRVELGMKSTIGVQTACIAGASYLIGDTIKFIFEQDRQVLVRQSGFLQQFGR
jgi:hypothetical protein